jgi:hypothetical protein
MSDLLYQFFNVGVSESLELGSVLVWTDVIGSLRSSSLKNISHSCGRWEDQDQAASRAEN